MRRLNLVIVADAAAQIDRDFQEIAKRVPEIAPDIAAYVISRPEHRRRAVLAQFLRPTLFAQVFPAPYLRVRRGFVARPLVQGKMAAYRTLSAAGLPVPHWTEIVPDLRLDPEAWGNYVVVKPDVGRRGAYVFPVKTSRVRFKPRDSYPEEHYGRLAPMLAQRFIYTGPYPTSFRVLTCFGEPLLALRYESIQGNSPLSGPDGFGEGLRPVVATARRADARLAFDEDVLALARRIHAVYPAQPVIGCDLMREAATGKLWIAEINMAHTWSLSSESGIAIQARHGLDCHRQFGAIERAAEAMVRATRQFAR